jgi:hypothetical protein
MTRAKKSLKLRTYVDDWDDRRDKQYCAILDWGGDYYEPAYSESSTRSYQMAVRQVLTECGHAAPEVG